MQTWIPVVSSSLYFWKSVFSFRVDSILNWRVYIKLKVSWQRAFLWCMSQTSRDRVNSRRVRTHEKNSGDAVRWLGTIIQSIFCAQSGASIRLIVWKWTSESRYPGAFPPVLKNFCRAFSPCLTDRHWVFLWCVRTNFKLLIKDVRHDCAIAGDMLQCSVWS